LISPTHADLRLLASRTWQYACFLALSWRSIAKWNVNVVSKCCPVGRSRATVARFRQINRDRGTTHRDALEFPDGEVVLLTSLWEGRHATVLQLPASPTTSEEEVQTRASVNDELAFSTGAVR
jgi:hypothetical protein